MAKNQRYEFGDKIPLPVASGRVSGDPAVSGQIPGVCLTDRDAAGNAALHTTGVYDLVVNGVDGSGNAAVAVGDILYYTAGDTIKLSRKATGVRFGYAMGAIGSGSSGTIPVKLGY
jgi:predicted RecA/RadA family phage recombinase